MPRISLATLDHSDHAGDIGRAILSHFHLPLDGIDRVFTEPNRSGLFISLKNQKVERRALVVDTDGAQDKLSPTEELKLLLNNLSPDQKSAVLDDLGLTERPSVDVDSGLPIASVFELESIFSEPEPITYLIDPEIPAGSIVYLAGIPESGKSTLACAWARDLVRRGHAALLLDRDRNPRAVIRKRLERLGVSTHNRLFQVWDCQQRSEAPQPDSPVVIAWVTGTRKEAGKSPLVIIDSAVSFLLPGEDENASKDIRSLFNRCRAVTSAGGSVLLLHHLGKGGDLRGSSDFSAAADQGFVVKNASANQHRLSKLTLSIHKTRYGLSHDLVYEYAEGQMVRTVSAGEEMRGQGLGTSEDATITKLAELLKANPGVGSRDFAELANSEKIPHHKARSFLKEGEETGKIRVHKVGRKIEHFSCNG